MSQTFTVVNAAVTIYLKGMTQKTKHICIPHSPQMAPAVCSVAWGVAFNSIRNLVFKCLPLIPYK